MKHFKSTFFVLLMLLSLSSCQQEKEAQSSIVYNQLGYITDGLKHAYVASEVDKVEVLDADGKVVMEITPEASKYWELSGDAVRKVDFSSLTQPGEYVLSVNDESYPMTIASEPYREVAKAAIKALYYNRAGMAIDPAYGGKWTREAGHPDTVVYVHSSAADDIRPEGTIISSPLGWYDAGDYNKYVVNSGITTYTMFRALEDFTSYHETLKVGIPDSKESMPDVLTELLYNFKWFITMQDPNDGGVYHKLTAKKFEDMVMPKDAVSDRYVIVKTTAATLNYAALTAHASLVLKSYGEECAELAETALQNAIKAWKWAIANPNILYDVQPADIETGAYGDTDINDEWFWAASELYLATGKENFLEVAKQFYKKPEVPTWNNVHTLGIYSLLDNAELISDEDWTKQLRTDFFALADSLVELSQTAPYGVSINIFAWGSNSQVANEGMIKLFAHKLMQDKKYLNSALSDLDYILGRNATGYCFVTGFGHKKVMNIHHRPSAADGIDDPVPGFLAGGPNTAVFIDCPDAQRSSFPAKSFVDLECSYSTNEIAINWNAPLAYLTGGIDALLCK